MAEKGVRVRGKAYPANRNQLELRGIRESDVQLWGKVQYDRMWKQEATADKKTEERKRSHRTGGPNSPEKRPSCHPP